MAANSTNADHKPNPVVSVLRWVNRYAGWVCVIIVGLSAFYFYSARNDLVTCSAAFTDENNRVNAARSNASVANSKAFHDVVKTTQPLLDPTVPDEVKIATIPKLFGAYNQLDAKYLAYEEADRLYPIPKFSDFCGPHAKKGFDK